MLRRFSRARECFEQVLKDEKLNSSFCDFLHGALTDTNLAPFIAHSCLRSPSKWESVREKQNFFLDACEAVGDRQLTAKYLQSFGSQMALHSTKKLIECIQDAPKLKTRLKEELNLLQLPSPAPVYVHALNSCLRDPCKSDEHKRDDLPDTLKAYCLLKRSIDIYSDLLHNWTQRSSNEAEWLQLLESQKRSHEMLLSLLLMVCTLCYKTLMKGNDSSAGANNYLVPYSKTRVSALKRAFLELSSITLVWVERGRARTLLNQLGPWYNYMKQRDGNPGSLKEELYEFDNNQEAALSSILSCRLVCKGEPLFVEYVTQTLIDSDSLYMNRNNALAYLIHKEAEVMEGVMFHCNGDEVEKLVNVFYNEVIEFQNPKRPRARSVEELVSKVHSVLEKLYDMLIEPLLRNPIFKHLDPEATVIFVPDKMLYRVPFALLRDRNTQKHLFQLHPIAVAPSLRVLQHCERRLRDLEKSPLKPEGCVLAVGNAAYKKNPLPGTGEELEHLRSCFPGRVKTIEKDEATRAKFLELVKEASHSTEQHVFACVHLGVHGFWSKDEPQEKNQYKTGSLQFAKVPQHTGGSREPPTDINSSGLRMNQSPTPELEQQFTSEAATISGDGERFGSAFGEVGAVMRAEGCSSTAEEDMLPSEDIIKGGFQWPTRLVVLSACNSSRGQDYTDGEVNLPRALMIAGVPAAVVSQWKVDDSASPALMKAFYENLQYGQDVATALQSSMIQLSNSDSESANIFTWGPFLVWGLPTVELPKELWTENARKTFPARQLAKALIDPLNSVKFRTPSSVEPHDMKVSLLNALKTVKSFLEPATFNARALEVEAITGVIVAVELVLKLSRHIDHLPYDAFALAEKVYTLLPSNLLKWVETGTQSFSTHFWDQLRNTFNKGPGDFPWFKIVFWQRIMFTQAMKGSHQIALEYANKMIEDIENAYRCGYDESILQRFREHEMLAKQERAVILRLMGRYEEALREFDDLLAHGKNYERLTQMSYLKHLMGDQSGALEYGRRAKEFEFLSPFYVPDGGAFLLSSRALPYEYREWLLSASCSNELPKELWTVNAGKVLHAKHLAKLLKPKLDDITEPLRCDWDDDVVDAKKVKFSTQLEIVNDFLELASGSIGCVFEEERIHCIVRAIEELLLEFSPQPLVSKEIKELAEDVYAILPLDQLQRMELQLMKVGFELPEFRQHIMYTQAMKGNHQTALEYANKMIEARQSANGCRCHLSEMQASWVQEKIVRQERAVILRLMGKYDEALKEFDDIVALGENYECLIQTSYLKHLMEDKEGALEYACRAKKLESVEIHEPGYGAFCLGFSALPDEYRQWLLNVDEVTGATLSSLWSLPTVQLPKELWTENTRKALAAKPRVVALKWKLECGKHKECNVPFLLALNAVDTFLASIYNACAVEEDVIAGVISAIQCLLLFSRESALFEDVIAVAEDAYTILPLEQLQSMEIESIFTQFWDQLRLFDGVGPEISEKRELCERFTMEFRKKLMYAQAMKGNNQTALELVNTLVEDTQTMYARLERAVILRLMGKYAEALKEFDNLLASGEDYGCLIQASYLKNLMGDESGALEYACRAKRIQGDAELDKPGRGAFCLGVRALPDEYRQWLSNVDDKGAVAASFSVTS
ncbi:hypothetical protein M758_N021900 [Ceratodon purpureus]|nr:hypothetical protein M758_N021900 [Ceratodon purpureus]